MPAHRLPCYVCPGKRISSKISRQGTDLLLDELVLFGKIRRAVGQNQQDRDVVYVCSCWAGADQAANGLEGVVGVIPI